MNIKQLKHFFLFLLSCAMIILCGCSSKDTTPVYTIGDSPNIEKTHDAHSDVFNGTGITTRKELSSGSLVFTIMDVHMVNHLSEIPTGSFSKYATTWQVENNNIKEYLFPYMIEDDGNFIEGCYLILVDFSVNSIDAHAIQAQSEDDPLFDDPFLFRADHFWLVDTTDIENEQYFPISPSFFSLMGQESEHSWAFRLEPNTNISYTIGFFIGGYKRDGTKTDISNLCLCNTTGDPDSVLINLGLGRK